MLRFARTCDTIAATTKKLEKTAVVATYLRSLPVEEAAIAAIFLSGRPFAAYEEATCRSEGRCFGVRLPSCLENPSRSFLRSTASTEMPGRLPPPHFPRGRSLVFRLPKFGSRSVKLPTPAGRRPRLICCTNFSNRATPLEAKYIVKIISGDLRIGLKESLVEEAIAREYAAPVDQVKRANMLLGDLGETLRLASAGRLEEARMRLFHPIDFMLASPVESAEEAVSYFQKAGVEDKYDGIRAQAHIGSGEARLFSRTRDEITESFPELPPALAGLHPRCSSRWRDCCLEHFRLRSGAAFQYVAAAVGPEES